MISQMIDKKAINIAIRAMTTEELTREAKHIGEKARMLQSLSVRMNRELKRRERQLQGEKMVS